MERMKQKSRLTKRRFKPVMKRYRRSEELDMFRAGSQEYIKLERSLADETAKLSVDTQ